MRKLICTVLILTLFLSLGACSRTSEPVPVERADKIMEALTVQDSYAGVVISEDVIRIARSETLRVQEVFVSKGDTVEPGQQLFAYDAEALRLELDRQRLELDKMRNQQSNNQTELINLRNSLSKASDAVVKTQLNIQISTLENSQKQLEYDLKAQNQTLQNLENSIRNVVVTSPVTGVVREVNEGTADFILLQKTGTYRVQGRINEMNLDNGPMLGTPVRIVSRIDSQKVWKGVVAEVNVENMDSISNSGRDGEAEIPVQSASYTFYVDLENSEGLLLGQHVYIQKDMPPLDPGMVCLPQSYFVSITTDPENYTKTAFVYTPDAEEHLELRQVVLGPYDETNNTYLIRSGLSSADYVADPAVPGCKAGAGVRFLKPGDFGGMETGE